MEELKRRLPPGVIFDPSKEQIFRYLRNKVYKTQEPHANPELIKELDLYRCCPSDHQGLSKAEDTYFFTQRVAKYQSSRLSDRTTKDGKGYWRRMNKSQNFKMGIRNTLVYHLKGGNIKGIGLKTGWIMQEYELKPADAKAKVNKTTVLCRIHHKKGKQEREETDMCNVREQVPDDSTKDGSDGDRNREYLMMNKSGNEYQLKNIAARA